MATHSARASRSAPAARRPIEMRRLTPTREESRDNKTQNKRYETKQNTKQEIRDETKTQTKRRSDRHFKLPSPAPSQTAPGSRPVGDYERAVASPAPEAAHLTNTRANAQVRYATILRSVTQEHALSTPNHPGPSFQFTLTKDSRLILSTALRRYTRYTRPVVRDPDRL